MLHRIRQSFTVAFCLTFVFLSMTAAVAYEIRWALSHRDVKLSLDGVGNFGRVNTRLYRGAQPTPEGFANLRAMGIDTVVRLSLGGEEGAAAEQAIVEPLGMRFVNLPWSSVREPDADQIVSFLTLFREQPDRTYFVHCKAGADRTGTFVALYRIVMDRWSPVPAIDEMRAFRHRTLFLPHLEPYVEAFPSRLTSDPTFDELELAY
jgi:protein tyrosine/serine phosphatase